MQRESWTRAHFEPPLAILSEIARSVSRCARWVLNSILIDHERWLLWLPVAFGTGIATYFALPVEVRPTLPLLICLALVALFYKKLLRGTRLDRWLSLMLIMLPLGFSCASLRAHLMDTSFLPYPTTIWVEGRIVLAEMRGSKQRVLLKVGNLDRFDPEDWPEHLRITLKAGDERVLVGDKIRVRARLQPPSAPHLPGGFDYARQVYFQQLGGLGYALSPVTIVDSRPGFFSQGIAGLRDYIASRVRYHIEGQSGAVAAALLTALRAGIAPEVWRDMQIAGLAHLLAISGLHMGLVCGTVFLAFRYVFALVPRIATSLPAKKPAAIVALGAGAFYLLLAGGTIPSIRAFLMTGIVLLAIMADRNPFSLRLVATAAILILLFRPEALLSASFQLSFAAVVALISFYEHYGRWQYQNNSELNEDAAVGSAKISLVLVYVQGVLITTLIASLATTPFAAYHFQRVAAWGVLANLVAVPLTAFWIMPLGLIALVLMPLGLEFVPLYLMSLGIDLLLSTASLAADMPGAGWQVAQMPHMSLVLMAAGGLWLALWSTGMRFFGIIVIGSGLLLAAFNKSPDLIINRSGSLVAIPIEYKSLATVSWRKDQYVTDQWQRAMGSELVMEATKDEALPYVRCDDFGCVARIKGRLVAIARTPAAAIEDCFMADLVISTRSVERCPNNKPMIGADTLWESEGIALYLDGEKAYRIKTVKSGRTGRLWDQ